MAGNQHDPLAAFDAVERDTEVVRLKRSGLSFAEIGAQLGFSRQVAQRRFQRAVDRVPVADVQAWRQKQLAEIEMDREVTRDIADAHHPVVSNGKVFDDLDDDAPRLAALAHLAKLRGQEQDLLGLKAPVKTEVDLSGGVRYEVVGVDVGGVV
jgi:hypothetical protein